MFFYGDGDKQENLRYLHYEWKKRGIMTRVSKQMLLCRKMLHRVAIFWKRFILTAAHVYFRVKYPKTSSFQLSDLRVSLMSVSEEQHHVSRGEYPI